MDTSTMFLNHITVLDHAYIDDNGNIIGGSFHPSFIVNGEIDPVEKVVIDFSSAKKVMKSLIDDKEEGFDHKLWIIEDYSNCNYEIDNNRIKIFAESVVLNLPRNAVKIFKGNSHSLSDVGNALALYLEEKMSGDFPGIHISCVNSITPHTIDGAEVSIFSYVHGLKDSTSWGCQNNSHGHLSFVQLFGAPYNDNKQQLKELEQKIANELDRTIFINEANVKTHHKEWLNISYETGRGLFEASYNRSTNKIVILETETTIEYLIEYIVDLFKDDLKRENASAIMVSEGLSKGAFRYLL